MLAVRAAVRSASASASASAAAAGAGRRSMSAIPVIDIGPLVENTDAGAKAKVAGELEEACSRIGFFTVVEHGVRPRVIGDMESTMKSYFDLPVEVKRDGVEMTDEYPYGYTGYAEESLSAGYGGEDEIDLKECFAIGPTNPAAGMPPVRWPSKPDGMGETVLEYYGEMEKLASHVLRGMAIALDQPENFFEEATTRHRSCVRALNYPELSKDPQPGEIRAGAHTDYGSLTLLLQDKVGGLQVQGHAKTWQDVPYIEGSYIVNIGDLMARWTNDKWVSTLHRVLPRRPRRQSIAFFQNINADHLVSCIDSCQGPENPPKYEPIRAWDHLLSKHNASVKL